MWSPAVADVALAFMLLRPLRGRESSLRGAILGLILALGSTRLPRRLMTHPNSTPPVHLPLDALALHRDVLRRSDRSPGWALLDLGPNSTATELRKTQRDLAETLDAEERRLHARGLEPTALTFFDQGETTPFHVDGGPEESVLLLGYEPSLRSSVLRVVDLPLAAAPASVGSFLRAHPNGLPADDERLLAMSTTIRWDPAHFVLVALCNSILEVGEGWRGLLHQASVSGDPDARRGVHTVHLGTTKGACNDASWADYLRSAER